MESSFPIKKLEKTQKGPLQKLKSLLTHSWILPFIAGLLLASFWSHRHQVILFNFDLIENTLLSIINELDSSFISIQKFKLSIHSEDHEAKEILRRNELANKINFSHSSEVYNHGLDSYTSSSCPKHNYTVRLISRNPFIAYIENFLTHEEIKHILSVG